MTQDQQTFANIEAEQAVLGKILVGDDIWFEVGHKLRPDDFSDPFNRSVFDGMMALNKSGRPIVIATLVSQVGGKKKDGASLSMVLAGMRAAAPEGEIGPYVDLIVFEASRRRALSAVGSLRDALQRAIPSDKTIDQIIGAGHRELLAAMPEQEDEDATLGDILHEIAKDATELRNGGQRAGLMSGLRLFDDLVGPMMPGDLIVIGGYAGMGKTALAMQALEGVAQQGIPVDFYSIEMKAKQLGLRYAAAPVGASAQRIMTGDITDDELQKLVNLEHDLRSLPMRIARCHAPTNAMLRGRMARSIIKRGTKLAAVDHLRNMRADNTRAEERVTLEQRVTDLKATAMALNIPIILLCHLSRYVNPQFIKSVRDIRRPFLMDFYGSSAIENTADVALAVHRPSWFLDMISPPSGKAREEWDLDRLRWRGRAEIVKLKDRMGEGSVIRICDFDGASTRFRDKIDEFGL